MCNAMAPLMRNGPVQYCLSPGIHPPAGSYTLTASVSTFDLANALIRYFRMQGWTRIALMTSTDASGQDAERGLNQIIALAENKDVTVVEVLYTTQDPPVHKGEVLSVTDFVSSAPPTGWSGPGEYLLPLMPRNPEDRKDYRVAPIPYSPGYMRAEVRIYRATAEALAQYREMPKPR